MILIVSSLILGITTAMFSIFMMVKDFASMGKNGKPIGFSLWNLPFALSAVAITLCFCSIF